MELSLGNRVWWIIFISNTEAIIHRPYTEVYQETEVDRLLDLLHKYKMRWNWALTYYTLVSSEMGNLTSMAHLHPKGSYWSFWGLKGTRLPSWFLWSKYYCSLLILSSNSWLNVHAPLLTPSSLCWQCTLGTGYFIWVALIIPLWLNTGATG